MNLFNRNDFLNHINERTASEIIEDEHAKAGDWIKIDPRDYKDLQDDFLI